MSKINIDDIKFLDEFFDDELTEDGLKELDERLKNEDFKAYYKQRLDQKYSVSFMKSFINYLPLILMLALSIIGIYLTLTKIL